MNDNSELINIRVKNVSKNLGNTEALDAVSLNFEAAKMHGIIGPEGAGKTTLMRILVGLLKPNRGTIEFRVNEKVLDFNKVRAKIAYFPQQPSLYPDLSIDEHLEFFRKLYQIDEIDYKKRRQELLHITQLEQFRDRPAGELSGGMYKKLGLMCALLRAPKIIILDEPTTGVDPISRRELWDLLYRLLDQKILILMSTSYMDEAERCSIVHLLEFGKVIAEGEPSELLQKKNVNSLDEIFMKMERDLKGAAKGTEKGAEKARLGGSRHSCESRNLENTQKENLSRDENE